MVGYTQRSEVPVWKKLVDKELEEDIEAVL